MAASPPIRSSSEQVVWDLLEQIPDPEIPVLSITDLGIVRWIRAHEQTVTVGLAPTYTGCPATEVIAATIKATLLENGFDQVNVERVLSPAWTTDWITPQARKKLTAYGIAPPAAAATSKRALQGDDGPRACPRCDSTHTVKVSEFGSTPCKASYKCGDCLEPFEYFKCL